MKVEFGQEDWSSGELRLVHESRLAPAQLAGDSTIEGYVRIVADDGSALRIYDDLVALLVNLGGDAPARCLGEGAERYDWPLTVHARRASVRRDGDAAVVECHGESVRVPAAALWPAVVAAALRFADLLARARPAEREMLRLLVEPVEHARALVSARGWRLPDPPAEDPPAVVPPRAAITWGGVELYLRSADAVGFYRELGFDPITTRPEDPVGVPQWVGVLAGGDPADLAERLAFQGVELFADDDRRVWCDLWGANIAWGTPTSSPAIARRVLRTTAPDQAADLYAGWLGWTRDGARLLLDGREMGIVEPADESVWRHYLAVADLEATVATALALGARELDRDAHGVWLADPFEGTFGIA